MRRRLILACVAFIVSCLLPVLALRADARQTLLTWAHPLAIQKAFRPYGYYSLVGDHPRGFESLDTIQYWPKSLEQSGPDISERRSGVTGDGGALYRYSTLSVNRKRFVFTTKKVKGISYSFAGRFLRTDFVNTEMNFDRPVLVGKLSKYRNGRKVAEANIKLSYFAGT
jgi:hypothetical protein